jgi:hypothetical protein
VYDTAFVSAFVGTDSARPFVGNPSAPDNSVGVFAHDACFSSGGATAFGCSSAIATQLAALPANQLVSLNALNHLDQFGNLAQSVVPVTNNDVRFIINSLTSQQIFGTPFGNAPRNPLRDARTNLATASVYKTINLGERAKFEMHLTLNNAFNHFNFSSVVPNMEFAGVGLFGSDYANPAATATLPAGTQFGSRVIWVGGRVTF